VRVEEDGLAVGADDRHDRRHWTVTRKLWLPGYRHIAYKKSTR
jgi:hypothetical protein